IEIDPNGDRRRDRGGWRLRRRRRRRGRRRRCRGGRGGGHGRRRRRGGRIRLGPGERGGDVEIVGLRRFVGHVRGGGGRNAQFAVGLDEIEHLADGGLAGGGLDVDRPGQIALLGDKVAQSRLGREIKREHDQPQPRQFTQQQAGLDGVGVPPRVRADNHTTPPGYGFYYP